MRKILIDFFKSHDLSSLRLLAIQAVSDGFHLIEWALNPISICDRIAAEYHVGRSPLYIKEFIVIWVFTFL